MSLLNHSPLRELAQIFGHYSDADKARNNARATSIIADYVSSEWDGDEKIGAKLTKAFASDMENNPRAIHSFVESSPEDQQGHMAEIALTNDQGWLILGSGGPMRRYMTPSKP